MKKMTEHTNCKKFDQLKVIKEKFLALEDNAKNYSFKTIKEKKRCHLVVNEIEFVEITMNILDNNNNAVMLYAQATEDGNFFITDDGFIAREFDNIGKHSLFSNNLYLYCNLDEFDTKIQDYFYMLSTLFNFLEFKWNMKNE